MFRLIITRTASTIIVVCVLAYALLAILPAATGGFFQATVDKYRYVVDASGRHIEFSLPHWDAEPRFYGGAGTVYVAVLLAIQFVPPIVMTLGLASIASMLPRWPALRRSEHLLHIAVLTAALITIAASKHGVEMLATYLSD